MGIELGKNQSINLAKKGTPLQRVRIGLRWSQSTDGRDMDIDAMVFICRSTNGNSKLLSDNYFVFYNNLISPDGAVHHMGDDRKGGGNNDNEIITVDLSLINPAANELSVFINIHDAVIRRQHFGTVPKAEVIIYDDITGEEIVNYPMNECFSRQTSVQVGSIFKQHNEWHFKAIGAGYTLELAEIVSGYGGGV